LQRGHAVALLVGRRPARPAVLALVPGEAAERLDVEAEIVGGALGPGGRHRRFGDAVEGGVDLHQREIPRVEAQLVALLAAPLELVLIEVSVVSSMAGSRNKGTSRI